MEPNPPQKNLANQAYLTRTPQGEFERTEPMELNPPPPPRKNFDRTEPMEPIEPNPNLSSLTRTYGA